MKKADRLFAWIFLRHPSKLQELLKMDKSSVVRHLLFKSIEEAKRETALNEYKKGKLSMGKAAELASLNLWEFIELCHKNQISLDFSEEEADLGHKFVEEFDLKKYKKGP